MLDVKLHTTQEKILAALLHSDGLHYSDLKPQEMEGSQFTFHLSKLVERGFVMKREDGVYALTQAGKNESNSIDFDSVTPRKQAKHPAVFCATRKDQSEFLIYTRLKNPFYGCQGFPTGKIQFGESSYETAKRELFEECQLHGEPGLRGIRHYRVYDKRTKNLLEDKVMYIFEIPDPSGELKSNKEGRFEWVSHDDITRTVVNPLEEFAEIFEILYSFNGTITYKEVSHYTDKFLNTMKIALCGSTDFYFKMDEIKESLEKKGHTVLHPRDTSVAFSTQLKGLDDGKVKTDQSVRGRELTNMLIVSHMVAIKDCDAGLIVNLNKRGMCNYIGGNTFLEMGFATAYGKPIYIYDSVPEYSPYFDEITGMKPIVLHQQLDPIMTQ